MNNITNSILNIAYGTLNNRINILYSPSSRLFDNIINDIDEINLFFDGDEVSDYYYDCYFSNNFLLHTNQTKKLSNQSHLKDIIGFHSPPPSNFKKEDLALLQNNTQNIHKIFFSEHVLQSWGYPRDNKTKLINYGIPITEQSITRHKNVLIFNLENNPQIESLYNTISSHIPNTDIVKTINPNIPINSVGEFLSQYKVCLDFGNIVNTIFAMSCGVECISPITNDQDNPLMHSVRDFNDILTLLTNILSNNTDNQIRQEGSKLIYSKYDYDTFKNNMVEYITNLKKNEIFLL
jgi:hypothetical protein